MGVQREEREPNVVLHGGPNAWSEDHRLRTVANPDEALKLLNGNRYEHFEPTGESVQHQGRLLRVLRWSRCTYVAE